MHFVVFELWGSSLSSESMIMWAADKISNVWRKLLSRVWFDTKLDHCDRNVGIVAFGPNSIEEIGQQRGFCQLRSALQVGRLGERICIRVGLIKLSKVESRW